MKVGEGVAVRAITLPSGQERWIPSVVIAIHDEHDSFSVEALRGRAFDKEGHTRMVLRFADRDRGWR